MGTDADICAGFEQGPIRPPNEASSLLVRVTRGCPWNRCAFCPVYKGTSFSLRSVAQIEPDIGAMAAVAARIAGRAQDEGAVTGAMLYELFGEQAADALQVARFVATGGRTAFLQDANSLIMPVEGLVRVLRALRQAFPGLRRVTTYARAHTVTKRSVADLVRLREAGLDRIHIGLESGSDRVLELMDKGASAARHIDAGRRAKQAGMELSEYIMPGLGGRALSAEHAAETARVLREIEPHFIRIRTLAIAPGTPLGRMHERGELEPLGEVETMRELRALLAGLAGTSATVRSDHVLNLLEEISGTLPEALPRLLGVLDRFLGLAPEEQELFIAGRRLGILRRLDDLDDPRLRHPAAAAREQLRERFPGPIDHAMAQIKRGFV
ncbi:MAG: radical SAM protein [Deltaproteobacteria bacterium]|nr:radical SAM protein [Deltaproteobacteria bacterium]